MTGICDYKMGNLASVKNAFALLGEAVAVESDPDRLAGYDRLILPGVGAFGDAMEHLRERGMDEALKAYADSGKPMLGICLGMQLLFDSSEEFGPNPGLGLIKGRVVAFDDIDKSRRDGVPERVAVGALFQRRLHHRVTPHGFDIGFGEVEMMWADTDRDR